MICSLDRVESRPFAARHRGRAMVGDGRVRGPVDYCDRYTKRFRPKSLGQSTSRTDGTADQMWIFRGETECDVGPLAVSDDVRFPVAVRHFLDEDSDLRQQRAHLSFEAGIGRTTFCPCCSRSDLEWAPWENLGSSEVQVLQAFNALGFGGSSSVKYDNRFTSTFDDHVPEAAQRTCGLALGVLFGFRAECPPSCTQNGDASSDPPERLVRSAHGLHPNTEGS